ncbi:MAG: hypothetical protein LAP40_20095 [Acidobacteriia bacterium]|nr:hypothetical protein [Terriglobia bacterium]
MKTLFAIAVLCALTFLAAPQAQAQNLLAFQCFALNSGLTGPGEACGDMSVTQYYDGVVYAQDEAFGLCDNGAQPYSIGYAFAACGPELATVQSGPVNNGVGSVSALEGVVNSGPGSYWADCYGEEGGDANEDGQCDPQQYLCLYLGGFCD